MEQLLTQLSKAYWNVNYNQFLEKTGFVDSAYSLDKFRTFQEACKKLSQFDSQTLEAIVSESKPLVNS